MTTEAFDAPSQLRRLLADGAISASGLQAITGVGEDALRSFVYGHAESGMTSDPTAVSADQSVRLSTLAAQLTGGMAIPDDERLKGILESLTTASHLTTENLDRLTGLDARDLDKALCAPESVPVDKKYEIAVRCSYLINALNCADNR
ncbi:HTH domain-containing protein [Herbiconiux sp. YIM B11900]|uniref:HTH domain-containing protein n=1 Tax=Herbiconiux sp. YIM B11900 TaxID=3404131 RepID=UPI003F87AFEE